MNQRPFCARCADGLRQFAAGKGSPARRFLGAALLGLGAAVAGAAIYWAVLEFVHINAALVTILIGFMVGKCVHFGSGGRGGWRYQLLAIFLTYTAITFAYVPAMAGAVREHATLDSKTPKTTAKAAERPAESAPAIEQTGSETPDAVPAPSIPVPPVVSAPATLDKSPKPLELVIGLAVLVGLAYAAPVAVGFPDILNLLIIFFGLSQAWRLNKPLKLAISGPYPLREEGSDTLSVCLSAP